MKHFDLKRGFTLVETIMVVGIYTMLLLVISTSIHSLYISNGYTIAQSYEIDHARRGLQTWLKDAREMTYADDGTFPIAVTEPHRVGFYSDIDSEPSIEYVEYVMSSTTLYKNIYKSAGSPPVYNLTTPYRVETLSEYVQNIIQGTSTFMYLDTSGALLTSTSTLLTDVRYLEARVIVNIDPLKSPGEFLLRSGVAPRNLKDNL
jgi:type II secretory pathway component PulJ